jgi:hypothetical protein
MNDMWLSFLFGTIGMGYLMYGKRQSEFLFMLTGGLLMIYPYFMSNSLAILMVGAALLASPFLLRPYL